MHVKEIYVIFIHLFDSGILLIIDLNKEKRGGGWILFVNFTVKEIYVIFIHLFDSGILLIIDLNKKKRGGGVNFICEFYS